MRTRDVPASRETGAVGRFVVKEGRWVTATLTAELMTEPAALPTLTE